MLIVSDIASRHLEKWLDELQRGELQLWELPPAVRAWYFAGYGEGITLNTQTQEIERLEHECDRLYLAAFSPKQKRDFLLQRHAERDQFEWELFESALLEIITRNSADVSPVGADEEHLDGHTYQHSRGHLDQRVA